MTDASIRSFVSALSSLDDGVAVRIAGEIEELSQQDYKGRRVNLKISDGRSTFDTKLDLGVHTSAVMEQDELWFDVAYRQEGVCLLANSKEQVFVEKLKSLLRHGIRSTRYRDLYDMYYIGHRGTSTGRGSGAISTRRSSTTRTCGTKASKTLSGASSAPSPTDSSLLG